MAESDAATGVCPAGYWPCTPVYVDGRPARLRPVAAMTLARHTRPMRDVGSDQKNKRWYGALGCLVLFLLPSMMLSAWLDGRLTWGRASAWIIATAIILAAPLVFVGRRGNGS